MDFNNLLVICIPFIAAILGIALPIIVQSIGRIDERYDSTRLVKRFRKERVYCLFLGSLISVIIIAFYNSIFCLPWKSDWGGDLNRIMRNSSDILLLLSTIILIVFLFLIVKLIIEYYDYRELFRNIKNRLYEKGQIKDDLKNNKNDIYDFFELAKYIARRDDNDTLREAYQFLIDYSTFKVLKSNSLDGDFDDWFYDGIILLNDIICKDTTNSISIANGNDIVKLLIPMFNSEYVISNRTYQVLWRILQQQLFYDRTELVFEYWTYAHHFISLYLTPINKVYDYQSDKLIVKNKEEVEKREAQIDRFKEFHLALCGMLLYYRKYELINRITKFSHSKPYSFPLIPSSFQEIVSWFSKLNLNRWERPFHIEQSYWLREERGVNAGDVMLGSINRFLTLLLYRLNSFEVQYTTGGIGQWDDLTTPIKLNDTTNLLSIIEQMKFFVDEWERENNQKIIESLGWMPTSDDIRPLMKIDQLIGVLNEAIETQKQNIELSDSKVELFNRRSLEIISPAVEAYQEVFKKCDSTPVGYEKDIINTSISNRFDREVFSDDQTISHANFDEVTAYEVVSEFYHLCFNSVYKRVRRSFTIENKQLFDALDKLIGEKQSDYVVIAFGLYLDLYLDGPGKRDGFIRIDGEKSNFQKYTYHNIEIYNVSSSGHSISDQFVAIIKKNDLPCFVANNPPEETKEKYGFEQPIDQDLKLYTSVLFDIFPEDIQLDETKYCLATIYYSPLLYWKKDADVTMLKLLSRYTESGKGQDISSLPEL